MVDGDLKTLLEPIDDLVARRNDTSHGVVHVDEIQSVGLLRERCSFVRAYGTGLYEMMLHDVLKYSAESGAAQTLGKPVAVFNNNTIVCFEARCRVAVGDRIFAISADALEPVRSGLIVNLQIDNVDKVEIDATAPVRFGARVEFHANAGHQYFSLPAETI